MRMWMVDPEIMCKSHLLGEHVELHMVIGSIKRKRALDGYLRNGLIEPGSVLSRHGELVVEMKRRGYNHVSLAPEFLDFGYLKGGSFGVDRKKSLVELLGRCKRCLARANLEKEGK